MTYLPFIIAGAVFLVSLWHAYEVWMSRKDAINRAERERLVRYCEEIVREYAREMA